MKKNNKIAHRGIYDNNTIPENSIKAFKKALNLGYSIELDIQLTKDLIPVIYHDDNLKRLTNIDNEIKNLNYNELKNIKLLNTNEHIPTLKEVLNLVNNKVPLLIEIKDNNKNIPLIYEILLNELKNYNNYLIQSFNPKILHYIKKINPNIQTGLLIRNNKHKIKNLIIINSLIIRYCKPDFISISKKLLNKKSYINLSKKHNTFIWTITEKKEINNDDYTYICNNLPY